MDLLLASAAAAAAIPLQPEMLLGLLEADTASEVSAKAVTAIPQLLLQAPQRPPPAPPAIEGGNSGNAVTVHISTKPGSSTDDSVAAQPVKLRILPVRSEQPAAASTESTDAAPGSPASLQHAPIIRQLPAEVFAALLAALSRPDAASVRAAAAAALHRLVAADVAAHISDLERQPVADSATAAEPVAEVALPSAAEAAEIYVRLAVTEAADSAEGGRVGSGAVCLTLHVASQPVSCADSDATPAAPQAAALPPVYIDLEQEQLAGIAFAAAQAASDIHAGVAAAAAALLQDVALPAALVASNAKADAYMKEPAWRVQVGL